MKLSFRQKLSYYNHLFKALTRSHHEELAPLFSKYIRESSTVFDIGGHAGQFTKLFSKMTPNGKVFTFEPSEYSRSILQSITGLKFMSNVFVLPFGLSDRPVISEIHTPVKKQGSLGYGLAFVGSTENYKRETLSSEIILSTIDSIVEALAIKNLDFIKADIEGSELLMLQGAEKSLKKFKPVLYLEVGDDSLSRNNHSGRQLCDYLQGIGYNNIKKINEDTGEPAKNIGSGEIGFNGNYLFSFVENGSVD